MADPAARPDGVRLPARRLAVRPRPDRALGRTTLSEPATLLRLDRVGVSLRRGGHDVPVLDALNLTVRAGEMLALVGESGSGKTIAALAVMRLLPPAARLTGTITLGATNLAALPEPAMRAVRGRDIGMVFQNALAALNPSHPIGRQIAEPLRLHAGLTAAAARRRTLDLLGEVGIANPPARIDDYPHQFSGGMRQRAMIAIALACGPGLLIADEPTTGLDPIIARQIMALLERLRRDRTMAVLFITHDLSAIEHHTDRVHVLYAGGTVEHGPAEAFFAHPRHPYSQALLGSIPRIGQARLLSIPGTLPEPEARPPGCRFAPRCPDRHADCEIAYPPEQHDATAAACLYPRTANRAVQPATASMHRNAPGATLLTLRDVAVSYAGAKTLFARAAKLPALHDITLDLRRGECLGIVGESGSGKSTLGRAVLHMVPYRGQVALDGMDFAGLSRAALRRQRRRIQVVFQDPRESLNPRLSIAWSIGEPLLLAGQTDPRARRRRVDDLLERVGLSPRVGDMRPGDVSGGQAQRVAIARALAAEPDIIVFDEPTSALDVSTQALLLNLIADLLAEGAFAALLISHDLAVVSVLAHRIAVLQAGHLLELAETATLLATPRAPYTAALIAAAPALRPLNVRSPPPAAQTPPGASAGRDTA